MIKLKLIAIMLLFTSAVTAQKNNGFYGKKFFFDFSARGAYPLINNIFENGYYKATTSKNLLLGKDRFNYGFSGSVGYAYQNNRAFCLNVSQVYGNIAGPTAIPFTPSNASGYTNFSLYCEHENLRVKTLFIMPTMCFSTNNSLLPVGISHEFGMGYRATKIIERDYVYNVHPFYSSYTDQNGNYHQIDLGTTAEANAFVDSLVKADGSYIDYKRKYVGLTLSYAMRIRKPLNDYLALNAGLRYSLNFSNTNDKVSDYGGSVQSGLLSYHRMSIITFDLGLTFLF